VHPINKTQKERPWRDHIDRHLVDKVSTLWSCQEHCANGCNGWSQRTPVFKAYCQLVADQWLINQLHGPLFGDVHCCRVEQFSNCLFGRIRQFVFQDLAQLVVIALHGIGGVDQPPVFLGELKKGSQLIPIVLPGFDLSPTFPDPILFQLEQIGFSLFPGGCLVDSF